MVRLLHAPFAAVLLLGPGCGPEAPDPLAELHAAARTALEAAEGEEIEELYGRLLAADPEWPDAAYELGAYFADNGYPKRAEPLLRRATDLAPSDPRPPLALGELLLRGLQHDAAERFLDEAIRRAPGSAAAERARVLLGDPSGSDS